MQLYPQEEYVVARGLEDHTDSSTYYVKAVIRNAKTDALIDTLTLTDQGDSHRFSKKWLVPADPTGLGFWITIVTSVYTDPDYTTKASNYGDKYDEKFIEARLHNHGGGGSDVDYKKVREIVRDELGKLPKPEPIEPPEPVDFRPVIDAIQDVYTAISDIKFPEHQPTDLKPVISQIEALAKIMESFEIPEPDFSGIEHRLDRQEALLEGTELKKFTSDVTTLFAKIRQFFGSDMDEVNAKLDRIEATAKKTQVVVLKDNQNDNE